MTTVEIQDLLARFRKDCEQAVADEIANAKNNRINYCVNYADLSVVNVWYCVDENGFIVLRCEIEEGQDSSFNLAVFLRLEGKYEEIIEVDTQW